MSNPNPIRLAILMEASTVTGPAKNLFAFLRNAGPRLDPLLITFVRGASRNNLPPTNLFLDAARDQGIAVAAIPEGFRFDPGVLAPLKRELTRFAPDILQSHNVKSNFFIRALGLHRTYPWIAFHHGYTKTSRMTELYDQLDRWSLRGARTVVTVCGPFVDQLAGRGVPRSRIRVHHNAARPPAALDGEAVAQLRKVHAINAQERVVLTVGRLSKEKAQADLIRAVAQLDRQKQPVRLVVVGDGPERDALEQLSLQLALKAPVFAGHQANVQPYYSLASVFVLPSLSEGSPNVVLEAMAAGAPIVATKVGGVPDIVESEVHALLVPPSQPGALAAAIQRVLEDGALRQRLVDASRQRILAEFTPEAHCQRMLSVYHEVLAGVSTR